MSKYNLKYKDINAFKKIVSESITKKEILIKLDINPAGGNYGVLNNYLKLHDINIDHLLGRASNKGKSAPNKKDALEYCYNGSIIASHTLKLKLIRDGYKHNKCENCKLETWEGETIPIELDHIDGNKFNNCIENLQILCPNCHSLKTKKQKKGKYTGLYKLYDNHSVKLYGKKYIKNRKISLTPLNNCKQCNIETKNKYFCSTNCNKIHNLRNVPLKKEIEKAIEIEGRNFSALGRYFNVSDNAVRKWFKKYELI